MRISLRDVRIGDKLVNMSFGDSVVVSIDKKAEYPIMMMNKAKGLVAFCTYDGIIADCELTQPGVFHNREEQFLFDRINMRRHLTRNGYTFTMEESQ